MRGASWRATAFPSLCGWIVHPERGDVLYDTGYAPPFFAATRPFPERLYRMLLPVTLAPGESLAAQLRRGGADPARVGTVLISHFHGDHVSGLADFPHARFVAMRADAERALAQSRLRDRKSVV